MSDFPSHAHIMEVGLRDGMQIEPAIVATEDKLLLLDQLLDAGIKEIEIGSFVSPRLVPQMADTPELALRHTPRPDVLYRALWLNERGLRSALATPLISVDGLLSTCASDAFSLRNTKRSVADSLAEMPAWISAYEQAGIKVDTLSVMAAFGCNIQGKITAQGLCALLNNALAVCKEHGANISRITLSDTMGWANPDNIHSTVASIRMRWPNMRVKLHLHDTRGLAIANAASALALGVTEFEAAIGGLGGCPFAGNSFRAAGNVCTEDLAFLCAELGVETGLNLDGLINAAQEAQRIIGRPLPGKIMKAGWRRQATARTT